MQIADLRNLFRADSGLISFTDSEVDIALNKGIKFLDRISFSKKRESRFFVPIEKDHNSVVIPSQARAVKDIWVQESQTLDAFGASHPNLPRHQLGKLSLEDIRNPHRRWYWYRYWYSIYFFDSFDPARDHGRPKFYCPISSGIYPTDVTADKLSFYSNLGDVTLDNGESQVILIWPNADQAYNLEVSGVFFTTPISATCQANWWTVNHPEVVVMAAIYTQDRTYRNTSGGLELLKHIQMDVQSIDNDAIEEEVMSAEDSVMGG